MNAETVIEPTWELICHHTYKLPGVPVDLSPYNTHGTTEGLNRDDFASDGVVPGSGTVRFPRNGSRIRIPNDKVWQTMGGVSVEVLARRSSIATNQTLVSAHQSFLFKLTGPFLFFFLHGPTDGADSPDQAYSSDQAVDFQHHPIPVGKWVKLRFVHDGLNTITLFLDDEPIFVTTREQGVLPVGPLGVSIGNQADRDDRFFIHGEIDEVKIWRLDPQRMRRKFLSRPFDDGSAQCWTDIFRRVRSALARDPECEQQLAMEIPAVIDGLHRAIVAQGAESAQRYARVCEEYYRLWRAGLLDSPEMKTLFSDWCTYLQSVGLSLSSDPRLVSLLQSECMKRVFDECKTVSLDCDPQAAALIRLLTEACG